MSRRWLKTLVIGAVLLHAIAACLSDDSLNPQPLPPEDTRTDQGEQPPPAVPGAQNGSGGTSGTPTSAGDGGTSDGSDQ